MKQKKTSLFNQSANKILKALCYTSYSFYYETLKDTKGATTISCKPKKDRQCKDLELSTYKAIIKSTNTHSNIKYKYSEQGCQ
jgi:hypothetical protein